MAVGTTAPRCCLDGFCKLSGGWEAHRLVPSQTTRQRPGKLSRAEVLFIMALFRLAPFKHLKAFHPCGAGRQHRARFGDPPHRDRLLSLMPRLFVPLVVPLHGLGGEQAAARFADSTKLAACRNRRIRRHKVSAARPRAARPARGGSTGPSRTPSSTTRARSWR